MRSTRGRWLGIAAVVALVAAVVVFGVRRRRELARPRGTVLVFGAWERTIPSLRRAAEERQLGLTVVSDSELTDPAAQQRFRSSKLALVLNARVDQTANAERFVRGLRAAGVRIVALDSRDWQGALVRTNVIETDATLTRYWRYSGDRNLARMLDYVSVRYLGARRSVDPPSPTPSSGLYHPSAPETFASLSAYRQWLRGQRPASSAQPSAAYVVHTSFITLRETQDIDAVVRALEARGLSVFTVFADDQTFLDRTLTELRPSLVMTQRHIGLARPTNGEPSLPERLGVAYLKPISAIATTEAEWLTRPEGLRPGDLAGQITVQELDGTIEPCLVSALATAGEYRTQRPIAERVDHFADRARAWVALQQTPNAEKRLAIVYYNAEMGGESVAQGSVSGMFLDVPSSLVRVSQALAARGYRVTPPSDATALIARLTREGRNYGPWAQDAIDAMARSGTAVLVSLTDYQRWFETNLTASQRAAIIEKHGPIPGRLMITAIHGVPEIVLPVVRLGDGVILMPQPEKGSRQDSRLVHDQTLPPSHQYVAAYLWLQSVYRPHAVVHFGTHGTLELLPRRAAGLGPDDFADALLGAMPNINPWILDNVAEATLARRRAYAVLVDHLVPPIERTEVNPQLRALHEDVERTLSIEPGPVRDGFVRRVADALVSVAFAADLLGSIRSGAETALRELDLRLHSTLESQAPRTLHVLGQPPPSERRPGFITAIVGRAFIDRVGNRVAAEQLVRCVTIERRSNDECLANTSAANRAELTRDIASVLRVEQDLLRAPVEIERLLGALEGRYVPPGPGNDPIRNPSAIPTGRNLYALDPEQIPSDPAMQVGATVISQMLANYLREHQRMPKKIALNLNGFETMRDTGVTEAQAFLLLGVEPVRDERGKVTDVRLVPRERLGRPRVDVVLAISGAYRDNFASRVRLLDRALRLAQASPESDNGTRNNTAAAEARLRASGVPPQRAAMLARMRIFGQPPGQFGTQLLHLLPRSGAWQDERELGTVYRENMRFAYGEDVWGAQEEGAFDEAMRDVDAISHVWASNMMSPLTNHHVYEYTGGLAMAARQFGGSRADTLIADVRDPSRPQSRSLREVIDVELQTRLLNDQWVRDMQSSGYAGAGHVSAYVENLFGWSTTVPGSVSERTFEQVERRYLRDEQRLGTRQWLERSSPDALLAVTTTLIESARRGYWHPDAATRDRLVGDYMQQVAQRGAPTGMMGGGNDALDQYVRNAAEAPGSSIARPTADAYRARVAAARATRQQASSAMAQATRRAASAPTQAGREGYRLREVGDRPIERRPSIRWAILAAIALIAGGVLAQLWLGRARRARGGAER